ncbi:MAG: aldo/keto reductase [Verrucomicrobiota bacterium]
MNYRPLGSTGFKVSEIGFGAWGLGGDQGGARAYGPTDDRESIAALQRALDLGITLFDTSDFYGFGHSEFVIGQAFKGRREKAILASKVGFLDATGLQDFSPAHIRQSLDGTLQRLGTDFLDIYQLHSPAIETLERNPEALETMKRFKQEGHIRSYGVSVRSPDDGLRLLRYCPVDCIQVNFNLTDQRALHNGLFDLCSEMGVGVIVRTPLCFGFLTGQYADKNKLAESDHRRKWPQEQIKLWHKASALFRKSVMDPPGQTPAQAALRFCLSYAAVSSVIPGMLTVSQVEENAVASDWGPLPTDAVSDIQSIYATHDFMVKC